MFLNIQIDAIFISDAHYNEKNTELKIVLEKIKNDEIKCSQLFLMGDIFDFLSFQTKYFIKKNQKIITLINELSLKIEIIYLEGNHDFNLKEIFPEVLVYKRQEQPVYTSFENRSVSLAHGDIMVDDSFYEFFTKIIRNKSFLFFLNLIDINNFISKKISDKLGAKVICSPINNFYDIIEDKIKYYKTDIIIEGHYHQDKTFFYGNQKYINLPALACNKKYFTSNKII